MLVTKEYKVQTEGRRQLWMSKRDDGKYQVVVYLTEREQRLATLVLEPAEFKRLRDTADGLLKK